MQSIENIVMQFGFGIYWGYFLNDLLVMLMLCFTSVFMVWQQLCHFIPLNIHIPNLLFLLCFQADFF